MGVSRGGSVRCVFVTVIEQRVWQQGGSVRCVFVNSDSAVGVAAGVEV